MNSIQIFNLNRLGRYAKNSLALNWKQTLLIWGTIAIAVFSVSIANMDRHSHWNQQGWMPVFLIIFFLAGIIYASMAFPAFRRKERSIAALMIPVTVFERFLYELIGKVILFFVLYPVVFYLASSFAVLVKNAIYTEFLKINFTPFEAVPLQELFTRSPEGQSGVIIALAALAFILAFAGAASFRKAPLAKTIGCIGGFAAAIAGYFYLLIEKLHIRHPWIEDLGDHWNKVQALTFAEIVISLLCLITLIFAYFKIKEKEAS